MKHSFVALGALLALPLCATVLPVNTIDSTTYENDQTLTIAEETGIRVEDVQTVVISAKMSFTLPSEDQYADKVIQSTDKFLIVADADGELLLATCDVETGKPSWVSTQFFVEEGEEVTVNAVGTLQDGRLVFQVKLNGEGPFEAISPATGATLTQIAMEGEGSATNLSVGLVGESILPAPTGGKQDSALVSSYVEWVNTIGKALPEGVDEVDAFAMNAGGLPKLEIVAIDPTLKQIKVKGSYKRSETEQPTIDLGTINGILYLTYSSTLGGKVNGKEVNFTTDDQGRAIVKLPEGAVFVRARVELVEPPEVPSTL